LGVYPLYIASKSLWNNRYVEGFNSLFLKKAIPQSKREASIIWTKDVYLENKTVKNFKDSTSEVIIKNVIYD